MAFPRKRQAKTSEYDIGVFNDVIVRRIVKAVA